MKTPMTITVEILLEHKLITKERGISLIEAEKQMIIDAWHGRIDLNKIKIIPKDGEQYYNETFKKL